MGSKTKPIIVTNDFSFMQITMSGDVMIPKNLHQQSWIVNDFPFSYRSAVTYQSIK